MDVYACLIGKSQRKHHFMFHMSKQSDEVTLVYPFWVLSAKGHAPILVDTGFAHDIATHHGVGDYRDPSESLAALGIAPEEIKLIVVSHLHYDHFGVPERFPNAEFVLQAEDVDYFTRRGLGHPACGLADPKSLGQLVELRKAGRVRELSGDAELAPGVRAVHVGGHTPGMQVTVLDTGTERLVLACDASHFYANLETNTPTAVIHNYEAYESGFETIKREAQGGRWLPGHDPKMLETMKQVQSGIYHVSGSAG